LNEIGDIVASLLDDDGSCRDLNFDEPTWEGVGAMISQFSRSFSSGVVRDDSGEPASRSYPDSMAVLLDGGGAAVLESGGPPIHRIQVYIFVEEDGSPYVELTFSPEDVAVTPSLRTDFIDWAEGVRVALRARRYYARYENVSWDFGDIGPASGVFLVSDGVDGDA